MKAVNEAVLATLEPTQTIVRLCLAEDADLEVEVDEMYAWQAIYPEDWTEAFNLTDAD